MTLATQNHIRDTITILGTVGSGLGALGDKVTAVPGIPPTVAHYWPFLLIGTMGFRTVMGFVLRIYNAWYPDAPPAPTPVLQQTGNALK